MRPENEERATEYWMLDPFNPPWEWDILAGMARVMIHCVAISRDKTRWKFPQNAFLLFAGHDAGGCRLSHTEHVRRPSATMSWNTAKTTMNTEISFIQKTTRHKKFHRDLIFFNVASAERGIFKLFELDSEDPSKAREHKNISHHVAKSLSHISDMKRPQSSNRQHNKSRAAERN